MNKFTHNGYYVDISNLTSLSNYPILALKGKGWTGINLFHNYDKMKEFAHMEKDELRLSYLFNFSTNKFMLEEKTDYRGKYQVINQDGITLKEICLNFYKKQPQFMRIKL